MDRGKENEGERTKVEGNNLSVCHKIFIRMKINIDLYDLLNKFSNDNKKIKFFMKYCCSKVLNLIMTSFLVEYLFAKV